MFVVPKKGRMLTVMPFLHLMWQHPETEKI